jgi:transposase
MDEIENKRKTKVCTLRIDMTLSHRLKKITDLKKIKPSRFIREAIKNAIDSEMPIKESKPVGRPKKNKAPSTKEIKTMREMHEFTQIWKRYKDHEALTVGRYIIGLYENEKLETSLKYEIEKIIDDC